MRYPPPDGQPGSARSRVAVLFALVNVPALLLTCWLGGRLYMGYGAGSTIELPWREAAAVTVGLVCGLAGNFLLYRGVAGGASRLRTALVACSEQKGQAEAARAAREKVLAILNHEIRTPLNGVLGMVQVLAQSELTEEQGRHVAVLKESAERLATLLERLLEGCEVDDDQASPAGSPSALLLSADEADRQRLGGMLTDAGCSVVAVADGRSGMTELVRGVVEGSPFTLIVLTDDLPPDLAEQWLRQVEQSPARCPVIVLPRKSNMGELRAALGQG